MAGARSDLFKWKRQTKPSSFHSGSNIKTWIKNVQRASDEAAREVFGEGYHGVLDQVYADDDALSEAQDLLNSWVKEKTLKTIEPELEFFDEKWASHPVSQPSPKPSKQHHLSASDSGHAFDVFNDDYTDTTLQSPKLGIDYDEELDEEIAVQEVVRNMLDKKVVKDHLLSDLGFDSKKNRRDPRTKMELRHKQVREKSENRRRDLERERREKAAQKEAQLLARQQLLQEEKERQAKAKKEEMMMHKEMAKIRKAMEDEQRMKKEQKEREQLLTAEARAMAQGQMKQEQKRKEKKQREDKEATEEMRRLLLKQMEEKAAEEARNNLRLFQKYFSAWYSVVVDQRIKFGKARALADWKIRLRAWNAWRAYIWHIKSDKEARAVAMEMKEKHRKEQAATQFYHRHLLQRCLSAWQIFVHHSKQEQELIKQQEEKANKMAALLEAAASGRLWNQKENKMKENYEVNERNAELSVQDVEDEEMSLPSTARQVDEMFSQGPRKVNTRFMTSARSSVNEEPVPGKPLTNAWGKPPPPNNRDKNARYGHRFAPTDHRNEVQRLPRTKQRTLSHTDKVEDLRSKLKERQSKNNENKKPLAKSRSVEMLVDKKPNTPQKRGGGSVSDLQVEDIDGREQVEVWSDLDTDRSAGGSKLLSREPKTKSDKPTTKPILLAMEARAKLRAERKAAIDERKRKLEEEKLAKLRLEQERKELEFLKEKQEMMKKKKEEKRLAQEMELEKKRRQEHLRKLNSLATEHYSKTLLIKYGLSPWKQLVAMAHQNMSSAVEHHGQALVITCFYPWLQYTRQNKARKKEAADQLYRKIILRRSWRSWRKYGQHMVRLEAVAEDYCASYLLKKYYHIWQDYVTNEQIALWQKEQQADEHNQWRLQKLAFAYWKKLIPMMKAERDREKRRIEMRKRVQAWLPDFQSSPFDSSP